MRMSAETSCLADGIYIMEVIESHRGQTRFGLVEYVDLVFRVMFGLCEGHQIGMRLVTKHPDMKKVNLHRVVFDALTRAVGIVQPDDPTDFHCTPFLAHIRHGQLVDFQPFTEHVLESPSSGNQSDRSLASQLPPKAMKRGTEEVDVATARVQVLSQLHQATERAPSLSELTAWTGLGMRTLLPLLKKMTQCGEIIRDTNEPSAVGYRLSPTFFRHLALCGIKSLA